MVMSTKTSDSCEHARVDETLRSGHAPLLAAASAIADGVKPRGVVLVEGITDKIVLETLAGRHRRDLDAEGVSVIAIGGAQAIGHFLRLFGPEGLGVRLAGLCDAGEEPVIRRALERAGLGARSTRQELEELGFYVCDKDLEDELIRALGADAVERVVASEGWLASFRTFQSQPDWRGRPVEAQLRRFLQASSRRSLRAAARLTEALDLDRAPRPLDRVLAHALG
jgi:hypothetical protein